MTSRPGQLSVKRVVIGAGGLGFDSRAGQIEHIVVNGSLSLRCFFETVVPMHALNRGDGPATRCTHRRSATSISKN